MTPAEADHLASVIHRSWPGARHVSLEVWAEELIDQDAGTVGTAIARLRRDLERPPSIARFMAEIRSLRTPANDPLPNDCGRCENTGWVPSEDLLVATNDPDVVHRYSQVVPCPSCPAGERAEITYAKQRHPSSRPGAARRAELR